MLTFEIDVKYIDEAGLNGDIKQTFKQTIVVPAQKFAYCVHSGRMVSGEGVFNVNPIVYTTAMTVEHRKTACISRVLLTVVR